MFRVVVFIAVISLAVCDQTVLDSILEKLERQQQEIDVLKHIVTAQAKQQVRDDVSARKSGSSRDSPEVPIYFSAAVAASVDIAPSGIVVYSDIIVNAGDLYAADGRFTCPVGGYYYFHVSVKSDALRVAQVDIVRDDGAAQTVIASAMSVDGYDHASNGVYFECAAGNTVYVRGGASGGRLYGETGLRYNTFGGGLIWVIS